MKIKGHNWVMLKKGSRFNYDFLNEAKNIYETREVIADEEICVYLQDTKCEVIVGEEILQEQPING